MAAKKQQKENVIIPIKAFYGIAPAIAIIGLLIAKKQPGPLLLFFIGIFERMVYRKNEIY